MRVQVYDIGNSHLKIDLWQFTKDELPQLINTQQCSTEKQMRENIHLIAEHHAHTSADAIIVISMSDNIVWDTPEGHTRWIPAQEPAHAYAYRETLPPYRETGKPHSEILSGIYSQLLMVKTQIHHGPGFRHPIRILPFSAYIASCLADDKEWCGWDYTHASNSGVFNYQILNESDPRFPKHGWHDCISEFIDAGYIDKKIYTSDHVFTRPDGVKVFLGGHDTTFANSNDTVYSTKPYISCGTWFTASVESSVRPNWEDQGCRYVVAPNNTILKQFCVPSPQTETEKRKVYDRLQTFLQKHLVSTDEIRIPVFGGWASEFCQDVKINGFRLTLEHTHYLTEQAATYAAERM